MLRADAVMATSEPAFQIAEDQMGDWEKVLGHAGIALCRHRQMPITAIRQRMAAPRGRDHHDPRLDRRLDKPAKRCCRTIGHDLHPNPLLRCGTPFDVLGLAPADFDRRDNDALIMDAATRAARPAADP